MTPAPLSPHVSVDLVTVAANPLMRAAASLLVLLGRLRASLSRAGTEPAHGSGRAGDRAIRNRRARGRRRRTDQIDDGEIRARRHRRRHRAESADADNRIWTQYSMLVRFFNERMGGVRFFKELERAKQNPAVNLGRARSHARLPQPRLRRGLSRLEGGPGAAAGHPARPLRNHPPRAAQDDRGPVAALAGPDDRARRQPSSGSRLVGRRARGGRSCSASISSAQRSSAAEPRRSR